MSSQRLPSKHSAAVLRSVGSCLRTWLAVTALGLLVACSALPPGAHFPKAESATLQTHAETALGIRFLGPASEHPGKSAFRILSVGVDGFVTRVRMAEAAEKTLDLQYYIFRGDETGRLLMSALISAANRGVRVRVLVEDGDKVSGDEQLLLLDRYHAIEVRVYNPFRYRGAGNLPRALEFAFNAPRLDYRMHNKLMVADNSVALVGGRNVGDQYFQVNPDTQFADNDVLVAGPAVRELSSIFDEFWKSELSIPAAAIARGRVAPAQVRAIGRGCCERGWSSTKPARSSAAREAAAKRRGCRRSGTMVCTRSYGCSTGRTSLQGR